MAALDETDTPVVPVPGVEAGVPAVSGRKSRNAQLAQHLTLVDPEKVIFRQIEFEYCGLSGLPG